MANTSIEATLKKIADTQLVHARLMETNERKWNKRFEDLQGVVKNHEGRVHNLERAAEKLWRATEKLHRVAEIHERRLESVEGNVQTMLASMDRLTKSIEDFIKGRKRENGRRQQ
ncbi:MAG: hypothetical protein HY647_04640 [Acidobacteria bacterium]|nr:hypothetical protein [Acidobacteriota bacterium]